MIQKKRYKKYSTFYTTSAINTINTESLLLKECFGHTSGKRGFHNDLSWHVKFICHNALINDNFIIKLIKRYIKLIKRYYDVP